MQMFLTSPDYTKCAQDLDDKRLNKIIVESAQIASTTLWILDCDKAETLTSKKECYLPTHENHPLVKWSCENYCNCRNILKYTFELCMEYLYRFGKTHKTLFIFESLSKSFYPYQFRKNWKPPTVQPNCTTNHKHIEDVYEAYRKELMLKWNDSSKWTKRKKPCYGT